MQIISGNKRLLTCGTYGIRLYEINALRDDNNNSSAHLQGSTGIEIFTYKELKDV